MRPCLAVGAGIDRVLAGYQVADAAARLVHRNQDLVDLIFIARLPVRAAPIPLVV